MNNHASTAVNKRRIVRCALGVVLIIVGCLGMGAWAYLYLGEMERSNFRNNQLGIRLENLEFESKNTPFQSVGNQGSASEWDVYIDVACLDSAKELYVIQVYSRNNSFFPRVRQFDAIGVAPFREGDSRKLYDSLPTNPKRIVMPYRGVVSFYIVDATGVDEGGFHLSLSYFDEPIYSFNANPVHFERYLWYYMVHIDEDQLRALRARKSSRCFFR